MKRNFLIMAFIITSLTFINSKANAQVHTGNVSLDITLTDAFAIVFTGDQNVHFVYSTSDDFAGPKTIEKPSHFKVISTKPYSVSVGATAFTSSNASAAPSVGMVNVSVASASPVLTSTGFTAGNQVQLSTAGSSLIASASPTIGTNFSINYTIPDATPIINKISGTVFTTGILYTVTTP